MIEFLTDWEIQRPFWEGLLVTLRIAGSASVAALLIGFVTAFAKNSRNVWLRYPATMYVELFRNTPLLIQLYLYYRGLQSLGLMLEPELCGVLALSLYTGAYITEVFRSGLLAIPSQQLEAGLSLGFSRFRVYCLILVPQAVRLVLPALGNQLISLTKNSSLVAFITVNDLFMVIYKGAVDHFMPVEYFVEGAAFYLALSLVLSLLSGRLERWLTPRTLTPAALGQGETAHG